MAKPKPPKKSLMDRVVRVVLGPEAGRREPGPTDEELQKFLDEENGREKR